MNQRDLQLQILHQNHLKNIQKLEKERQLLHRDFIHPHIPLPLTHSPTALRPDPVIQQILYHPNSKKYPTLQTQSYRTNLFSQQKSYQSPKQSQIAAIQIQGILNRWNKECTLIPFSTFAKKRIQIDFQRELTPHGKADLLELFQDTERVNRRRNQYLTLKEKYSSFQPQNFTDFLDSQRPQFSEKQFIRSALTPLQSSRYTPRIDISSTQKKVRFADEIPIYESINRYKEDSPQTSKSKLILRDQQVSKQKSIGRNKQSGAHSEIISTQNRIRNSSTRSLEFKQPQMENQKTNLQSLYKQKLSKRP